MYVYVYGELRIPYGMYYMRKRLVTYICIDYYMSTYIYIYTYIPHVCFPVCKIGAAKKRFLSSASLTQCYRETSSDWGLALEGGIQKVQHMLR